MAMTPELSGTDTENPSDPVVENAIDIFILSNDAAESRQLDAQLTGRGYRVTLFSDSSELLQSLRTGKPNLLVCNATGPDEDGYAVCREIKADNDLWRVPVLLLTSVSGLGDLLQVLDCNADNFIARPYDPSYLASLVELLLSSTVEKPDPEKVRTQFKIRHDDQDYVITADRRKLLEFLLSSFEIAVGKSADLVQVQDELAGLKETLEQQVADRTAELKTSVARLQTLSTGQSHEIETVKKEIAGAKKEGDSLRRTIAEREKTVSETKEELSRVTQELETARGKIAETEDSLRTLSKEKEELEHALRGDAESLDRELKETRAALDAVRKDLSAESGQRTRLESDLAAVTQKFNEAEKALSAQEIRVQQLSSSIAAEKNRADTASQEVKSVLLEKERAEQELRDMIAEITAKAAQQSQEFLRVSDELGKEKDLRAASEQQCRELEGILATKEAAFAAEKGTLAGHHGELQQKYDALTEQLGAERQKAASYEEAIGRLTASEKQLSGQMEEQKTLLGQAAAALERENAIRTSAEKSLEEAVAARDHEAGALKATISGLTQDLEKIRAESAGLVQERDAALAARQGLEKELVAAQAAGAEAEKAARSAASDAEHVQGDLETERRQRRAAEEKLAEVSLARDTFERDLGAAGEARESRERDMTAKIAELAAVLRESQEAQREALESVSRIQNEKAAAEQRLRAAEDEMAAGAALQRENLKKAEENLKTALDRQRSLEEQLREAESGQSEKEAAGRALEAKIEEAGSAAAMEREQRLAAEAAYAEANTIIAGLKKKLAEAPAAAIVPAQKTAVLVQPEPAFPAVIPVETHAISRTSTPAIAVVPAGKDEAGPASRIRTVEDLFEEPDELDIHDLPDVAGHTPVPAPAADVSPAGSAYETPAFGETGEVSADAAEGTAGDGEPEEVGDDGEPGDDEAGEPEEEEPARYTAPDGRLRFGRDQWLDLVKWAHNSGVLSPEERIRIVKMGRLIQKGRQLTGRQESQLTELVVLARANGYQPKE